MHDNMESSMLQYSMMVKEEDMLIIMLRTIKNTTLQHVDVDYFF